MLGEDSLKEEDEKTEQQQSQPGDMTDFAAAPHEVYVASQMDSSTPASPLAEIYAQEYKARNSE